MAHEYERSHSISVPANVIHKISPMGEHAALVGRRRSKFRDHSIIAPRSNACPRAHFRERIPWPEVRQGRGTLGEWRHGRCGSRVVILLCPFGNWRHAREALCIVGIIAPGRYPIYLCGKGRRRLLFRASPCPEPVTLQPVDEEDAGPSHGLV